jgi:hypothetical protein
MTSDFGGEERLLWNVGSHLRDYHTQNTTVYNNLVSYWSVANNQFLDLFGSLAVMSHVAYDTVTSVTSCIYLIATWEVNEVKPLVCKAMVQRSGYLCGEQKPVDTTTSAGLPIHAADL